LRDAGVHRATIVYASFTRDEMDGFFELIGGIIDAGAINQLSQSWEAAASTREFTEYCVAFSLAADNSLGVHESIVDSALGELSRRLPSAVISILAVRLEKASALLSLAGLNES
jgi:hypothetical protein